MIRFRLMYTYTQTYNIPKTRRSRWSRRTGDVTVGETDSTECVRRYYNKYIYTRNDYNIILYSTYRKIWTGSIKFNVLLELIYYSRRL